MLPRTFLNFYRQQIGIYGSKQMAYWKKHLIFATDIQNHIYSQNKTFLFTRVDCKKNINN